MKRLLTLLIVSAAVLTVAIAIVAAIQLRQGQNLRDDNQRLTEDLRDANEELSRLRAEQSSLGSRLSVLSSESDTLKTRLAEAEAAPKPQPEPVAPPKPQASQQVKVYVGRDYLGLGWMVSGQTRKDATSGTAVVEPILLLDESTRRNFTQWKTNTVEREVVSYYTQNYNNDPGYWPYYYWVSPGEVTWPSNRPPASTYPPTSPPDQPTRPPTIPPGSGPWTPYYPNYGTGKQSPPTTTRPTPQPRPQPPPQRQPLTRGTTLNASPPQSSATPAPAPRSTAPFTPVGGR